MNRILTTYLLLLFSLVLPTLSVAEESRNRLPKKKHRDSNAPFLTPKQAVEKMAIPEGFDVSVFASEPDIAEPIAFCFDDRGRMWIAENFNYQTRGKHLDGQLSRIQILEDTNGDGVFDTKKTFSDKLTFISGLACGFGGVFVGTPPTLSFIPDADQDDQPDGEPEVLLDGWGMGDRHETLNSFIWGPDGWLYGCHGVFTKSRVGKPGDDQQHRQFIDGGIWRYHPTRNMFEIFARGLSNPWGFDFDDHGQSFATCCVIPHLFHIVQGGVYHKQSLPHVHPYIYDDIKTIRDHTHLSAHGGARFYLADAFPKAYQDRLFMCNIHEHAVLTDVMVPNGSSFIGKHGDDFLPTNDLAWVGFSIEIGPEGGVYILDWHDTDVCGNAINFPNTGRVYRVLPKHAKRIERPNLRAMSDIELVELQHHANDWYVRHARTLLQSRLAAGTLDKKSVHRQLDQQMKNATTSPNRLRSMWALQVTDGMDRQRLMNLLSHGDPYIRSWAIQFLCDPSPIHAFAPEAERELRRWDSHSESLGSTSSTDESIALLDSEVLDKFAVLAASDPSPIVRLYLASACQRMPFVNRWPILAALAFHGEDVEDNNLPRMIWFALEPMVPNHPNAALKLATTGKIPKLQEFVARRMVATHLQLQSNSGQATNRHSNWQSTLEKVAPGFKVQNVGEGGVVAHKVFRNAVAVQTHPLDQETACCLSRKLQIPKGKRTALQMRVSHHPHGDWALRVLVNDQLLADPIIGPKTVSDDEWLDVRVDLTRFAGQTISLVIENHPNDWSCEWAYWNKVLITSD